MVAELKIWFSGSSNLADVSPAKHITVKNKQSCLSCVTEAIAELRYCHFCPHFMKLDDDCKAP
jgi:hypothetical protein